MGFPRFLSLITMFLTEFRNPCQIIIYNLKINVTDYDRPQLNFIWYNIKRKIDFRTLKEIRII